MSSNRLRDYGAI